MEYPDPPVCPSCGVCGEVVRFGKKQMKFRDLPLHGRWVTLWMVRLCFLCRACNGTFRPALPEMAESHRMTKRLADYIIKSAVGRTNSDVVSEVGVDEAIIRKLFRDHYEARKDGSEIEAEVGVAVHHGLGDGLADRLHVHAHIRPGVAVADGRHARRAAVGLEAQPLELSDQV